MFELIPYIIVFLIILLPLLVYAEMIKKATKERNEVEKMIKEDYEWMKREGIIK